MIAHIDADAFFASALQRKRPDLRGKPLLALGMGGGCVIAASYEAKAHGVKTGMQLKEARKLCPQAVAVPSDFDEALLASKQIESILKDHCPIMEQMSVDEWFLDLMSLPGAKSIHWATWAKTIQEEVSRKVGLTISVGIAPSKLLSKMASEYKKPAGITIISNEIDIPNTQYIIRDTDFLKDRPAAAIPGIGRQRTMHTQARGWETAWDIAHADAEAIVQLFGKPGREMQLELLGECVVGVSPERALPKSISRCRSFRQTRDRDICFAHLLHHLTYTVLKMRRKNLACRHVSVWIRNGEYKSAHYDSKLPQPMDNEDEVFPYIKRCFDRCWYKQQHATQVGLGLYGLQPKVPLQYSLFEDTKKAEGKGKIQTALDALHKHFGRESVTRGSASFVKTGKKPRVYAVNE